MALLPYALTTLANVKLWLFNDVLITKYDSLLEFIINDVTDWIEMECGNRRFKNDLTNNLVVYDGDIDNTGRDKLFLKRWPVTSFNTIQGIEFNTGTNATPIWEKQDLDRVVRNDINGVYTFLDCLPYGQSKGLQNVRLITQAGYLIIPNDLQIAATKMVAKEFNRRNSQGALSENAGGDSVSWNEQVDPSAQRIFNKYRRF